MNAYTIATARTTLSLALICACTPAMGQTVDGSVTLEERGSETVFNYRGARGPQKWATLDDAWSACGEGESQSPIDISSARRGNLQDPVFDYRASTVQVVNNGHTVEFVYESGSTMSIGDNAYEVAQFHFHTPSEHTFRGGAHFPIEMHIVHKDAVGRIAVVGVMLREGARNPALPNSRLWGQMLPREAGVSYELKETIDVGALLPDDRRTFRYSGSLTTPPCSEQVRWLLMARPVEVSRSQLAELRQALNQLRYASNAGTNNRPTQARNGRRIHFDRSAN